jgi:hypothetical protein
LFNLGGIGYGWLQTEVPILRNFNFKWSYVPEAGYEFPPHFTLHYDAHTYWLALNVNNLLPSRLEPYWPDFLQLAIGYGGGQNSTRREALIGLDINLEFITAPNQDLLLVQKTLNMIHFPAPAVKFTEKAKPKYYWFHTN